MLYCGGGGISLLRGGVTMLPFRRLVVSLHATHLGAKILRPSVYSPSRENEPPHVNLRGALGGASCGVARRRGLHCLFLHVAPRPVPWFFYDSYLVDPASSHMLVSKIKPCMSKYKLFIR